MNRRIFPWWTAIVAIAASTSISGRFDRPADAFSVAVTGRGRPIVLIPGLATTGAVWDDAVARWRGQYELHVLTLAGFGGPEAVGEPFLPRVARALVDYTIERGLDRPVVIGHSLGAFVAFMAASSAPDRFGAVVAVDGVPFLPALMNPEATAGGQTAQAASIRALYASLTRDQFLTQNELALSAMITDPINRQRAMGWASQSDPAAVGIAVSEMLTTDLREPIGAIKAPVLLIGAFGAAPDAMRGAMRSAYAAQVSRVPGATVAFAETARHFVMLDDPQWFFATVEPFLAASAAAGGR